MPVEFLSDAQVAAYGCFGSELPAAEVERFFYLDEDAHDLIAKRRVDSHRLGMGVQIGTVRAVGRFLEDPLQVPWPAVEFVAEQLDIADASCVKGYLERPKTAYEHAWEIAERHGYRSFEELSADVEFGRFLEGRAWTHAEGPVALFEQSVGWLRRHRVLLPGVTVLARRVAAARDAAEARLHDALAAAAVHADPDLPRRLRELLAVPEASRTSGLEYLRRAPRRSSGPEMVKALQRVEDVAGLGAREVDVSDVPVNRLTVLARVGLGSKATALARMSEPRRTATLLAVVRHLDAVAIDDALDLFGLLMATRLLSPARRASTEARLAMLPRLERASRTVARAGRVLLDALTRAETAAEAAEAAAGDPLGESQAPLDVAGLWAAGSMWWLPATRTTPGCGCAPGDTCSPTRPESWWSTLARCARTVVRCSPAGGPAAAAAGGACRRGVAARGHPGHGGRAAAVSPRAGHHPRPAGGRPARGPDPRDPAIPAAPE